MKTLRVSLNPLRLFRGADAGFFTRVAQQPRARRQIGADELIYEAGDPADAVFAAFPADAAAIGPRAIVELTLPTGDAGAQVHVEHVVAGDVFGEFELVAAGLIDGRIARRSSARALVACDLYRIPFSLLAPVLAEVEAVRGRLIRLSMDRLIAALNVRSTHLLGDRDIALANWLVDAADNLGIAEGRHVRFPRAIGQREIAEALGVSRETISLRLNEWERAGLLNTGGQSQRFEILDYPRVALRAAIRRGDVAGALTDALAEIDADLDHGELVRARNVALDMLMFFPASPELRHRIALASMRAGAVREAVDVLAHGGYATGGDIDLLRDRVRLGLRHAAIAPARLFFGSGEPPADGESSEADQAREPILIEDIAAIEARARKEMAFAARDDAARGRYAAVSARLYGNIFDATGGYYAGINTAVMARVAGDMARAGSVARRVLAGLGNAPKGYWPNATLGEARLLLGDEARSHRSVCRGRRPGRRHRRQALLHPPAGAAYRRSPGDRRRQGLRAPACRAHRRLFRRSRWLAAASMTKRPCVRSSSWRLPRKMFATCSAASAAGATSSSPRRRSPPAANCTSCCRFRWRMSSRRSQTPPERLPKPRAGANGSGRALTARRR